MRAAFVAMGFIFGACVTKSISQITEYTLNSSLPSVVFLEAEGEDLRHNKTSAEANGYKCFSPENLKSMKRYIVDIEEQLKTCEKSK